MVNEDQRVARLSGRCWLVRDLQPHAGLTARELAVLRYIRDRWTEQQIGAKLAICERRVRHCVQSVNVKLGVTKRA